MILSINHLDDAYSVLTKRGVDRVVQHDSQSALQSRCLTRSHLSIHLLLVLPPFQSPQQQHWIVISILSPKVLWPSPIALFMRTMSCIRHSSKYLNLSFRSFLESAWNVDARLGRRAGLAVRDGQASRILSRLGSDILCFCKASRLRLRKFPGNCYGCDFLRKPWQF